MATKRAVVKKDDQVPAWMLEDQGKGTEDIGADAVEVPRIKLLQALSPELEELDDVKPGQWLHTIADVGLPKEIEIIPVYTTTSSFLWRPRPEGGILARALDGTHWDVREDFEVTLRSGKTVVWSTKAGTVRGSGLAAWGSEDPDDPRSPPAATNMINVVCVLPEYPELSPVVLTFQRSGYKIGKRMMGNLKLSRIPSFGRRFMLSSVKVDGPQGAYLEPRVKAVGLVEDQELYEQCKAAYETFKAHGVKMDAEPEDEAPESDEY